MRLSVNFTLPGREPARPDPEAVTSPLTPQDLEALLWQSRRANHASAWHGHVAFAHWLVQAMRPRVVVELGTHHGVSFASFCHAVAARGLPTRCFAVDTWRGDAQAGAYGEDVHADLKRFVDAYYSGFATLLRSTFDEALPQFPDRCIDLLHIDGQHGYANVRHDFDTWFPKLSDQAVVLFHDTAVREPTFGVWRLWEELTARYPSFAFEHGFGLGALAVGPAPAPPIAALCALADAAEIARVRACMARCSELARSSAQQQLELAQLRQEVAALRTA
jgi:O-antigen biosynthesis protein